jgi:integrase
MNQKPRGRTSSEQIIRDIKRKTRKQYSAEEKIRIVLNKVAESVVNTLRSEHGSHEFSCRSKPVKRMLNGAWLRARHRVGSSQVRVHDLKHTFGRRLRAAAVGFEDRQDLLGHRSGRITTHYSAAELSGLTEAANRVCEKAGKVLELLVLRRLSVS